MTLIGITLFLMLIGVVAYIVGAIGLAKFAFRLSTGQGLAVILFPPYTFYFAFARLEEAGKEMPTAMCMFGIVTTAILSVLLVGTLQLPAEEEGKGVEQVAAVEAIADTKATSGEEKAEKEEAPAEEAPAEEAEAEGGEAEGKEAPAEDEDPSVPE